jgi:8-amino-7-oxononanoate synthase
MPHWRHELRRDLDVLAQQAQLRSLRPIAGQGRLVRRDGRERINLASNDYLGLSQHPHLKAAAIAATQQHGVGSGASRLVTGHLDLHQRVEQRFAAFKHAPSALLCPTGYAANLAVLTALAAPGDLVCLDKLCHASLIDAARASGAAVRTFPHLRTDRLARLLRDHQQDSSRRSELGGERAPRRFVVTDSVFSMDGDVADLPPLVDLAHQHDAIVIVDEAHGTGVLGDTGAGLCELQGVSERVDIVVSTASKALGGLGGIVTSSDEVIQTLVNRARPFIYSTAVPPAQAATLEAALDVVRDEPWRRQRVLQLAQHVRNEVQALGLTTTATALTTPIIPVIVGSSESALELESHLLEQGFLAPAIRPPTVPPRSARVRLSLGADVPDDAIERLLKALRAWSQR